MTLNEKTQWRRAAAPYKHLLVFLTITLLLAGLVMAALWEGLTVETYTLRTEKLTAPVRLAVLADLHSTVFGDKQEKLIALLRSQSPDAVLIPGDVVDDEKPFTGAQELLSVIGKEYPCYYVSGNHEYWTGRISEIKAMLTAYGVTVLEGSGSLLRVQGQTLRICGVDDPDGFESLSYITDHRESDTWQGQFDACHSMTGDGLYTVLLSHRPELYETFRNSGFDLVLSGHAHGGQVRIPLLMNGLFAPNQGYFPKYAGGAYPLGSTTMIVSRGLTKNKLPRVFNPPELVIVTLVPK